MHRRDAISDDPFKRIQQYRPSSEFPASSTWYNAFLPCKGRPSGVGCDEFPNKAIVGAGPPAQFDGDGNLVALSNTSLQTMAPRAVLPQIAGLLGYYERRAGDDEHSLALEAGTLRGELELLWQVLVRNVPADRWEAAWRAAERFALDLQRRP